MTKDELRARSLDFVLSVDETNLESSVGMLELAISCFVRVDDIYLITRAKLHLLLINSIIYVKHKNNINGKDLLFNQSDKLKSNSLVKMLSPKKN